MPNFYEVAHDTAYSRAAPIPLSSQVATYDLGRKGQLRWAGFPFLSQAPSSLTLDLEPAALRPEIGLAIREPTSDPRRHWLPRYPRPG